MPETTYPWELFSGFRSNTYPLLGSLMAQACRNKRGEEAHSKLVHENTAKTEQLQSLPMWTALTLNPVQEAALVELTAPCNTASEALQVGHQLRDADLI